MTVLEYICINIHYKMSIYCLASSKLLFNQLYWSVLFVNETLIYKEKSQLKSLLPLPGDYVLAMFVYLFALFCVPEYFKNRSLSFFKL